MEEKKSNIGAIIGLIVIILIIVAIALFVAIKATPEESGNEPASGIGMPNPMIEVNTVEGIQSKLSFFKAPTNIPEGYSLATAFVISDKIGDVRYTNEAENQIMYRMALIAEGAIDGDYNEYAQTDSAVINDTITAKLKGNNGLVYLATWKDDSYTYSLSFNNGLEKTAVISMINSVVAL